MSKREVILCDGCGKVLEEKSVGMWVGYSNFPDIVGRGTMQLNMRRLEGAGIGDGHACPICKKILENFIKAGCLQIELKQPPQVERPPIFSTLDKGVQS